MNQLYWATLAFACVAVLWDIARRHFAHMREELAAKAGDASERAAQLDKRIKDLEHGQRELVARLSGAAPISRFQKRG